MKQSLVSPSTDKLCPPTAATTGTLLPTLTAPSSSSRRVPWHPQWEKQRRRFWGDGNRCSGRKGWRCCQSKTPPYPAFSKHLTSLIHRRYPPSRAKPSLCHRTGKIPHSTRVGNSRPKQFPNRRAIYQQSSWGYPNFPSHWRIPRYFHQFHFRARPRLGQPQLTLHGLHCPTREPILLGNRRVPFHYTLGRTRTNHDMIPHSPRAEQRVYTRVPTTRSPRKA